MIEVTGVSAQLLVTLLTVRFALAHEPSLEFAMRSKFGNCRRPLSPVIQVSLGVSEHGIIIMVACDSFTVKSLNLCYYTICFSQSDVWINTQLLLKVKQFDNIK